jgi:hypothetical protein
MNIWNPHRLKDKDGNELNFVPSFTNDFISLQKNILKRFEKTENTVSIIIQGPLNNRSINTIDEYLKYGEVVVSCWDNNDISKLDKYKDKIKIVEIVEHEDGSAYVSMTMDPEVYAKVFSAGFIHLIMKGIKDVKD